MQEVVLSKVSWWLSNWKLLSADRLKLQLEIPPKSQNIYHPRHLCPCVKSVKEVYYQRQNLVSTRLPTILLIHNIHRVKTKFIRVNIDFIF